METECAQTGTGDVCRGPATTLTCPALADSDETLTAKALQQHVQECPPCGAAVIGCARGGCFAAWEPLNGIVNTLAERTARDYRKNIRLEVEQDARAKGMDLLYSHQACDPAVVRERGFVGVLSRAMSNQAKDTWRRDRAAPTPVGEDTPMHDKISVRPPDPAEAAVDAEEWRRLWQDLMELLFEPVARKIREEIARKGQDPRGGEPLFWAWLQARLEMAAFKEPWNQSGLAKQVGTSQPTVSRRISKDFRAALETRMEELLDEPADRAHRNVQDCLDRGARRFLLKDE